MPVDRAIAALLTDLEHHGVRLRVTDGRLRCAAAPGVLTAPLLGRIRAARDQLVAHVLERDLLPRAERGGVAGPLSFAQQRVWLAGHLDPDSSAHHIPLDVRLTGALHPAVLHQALAEVVRRHEALRTAFPVSAGRPGQVVTRWRPPLPLVDLGGLAAPARERVAAALAAEHAGRPFDLASGPVLRTVLLRGHHGEHELLLTRHHIASDGWSFGVLATELSTLYGAYLAGRPSPLAPLRRQYVDFAAWQQGLDGEQPLRRWVRRLSGAPFEPVPASAQNSAAVPNAPVLDAAPVLGPAVGLDAALVPGSAAGSVRRELGPHQAQRLRQVAAAAGATPFAVLAAAFALALGRGREVVLGCAANGRSRAELQPLIGCFATVLPLRLDPGAASSFADAARQARDVLGEALADQDVALERIATRLRVPRRHYGRTPLFGVALAFQNTPDGLVRLPGVRVRLAEPVAVDPKFTLTVTITEDGGGYRLLAEYDAAVLRPADVSRLLDRFDGVLAGGCDRPQTPPVELLQPGRAAAEPLPPTPGPVPSAPGSASGAHGATLASAFASVVARTPDAIAVSQDGHQLSYAALYRRAAELAAALHTSLGASLGAGGVGPETPVGLCAEHSPQLVLAVLAVTMAGGCSVPVDPQDPPARREAVLTTAGAVAMVTSAALAAEFAWFAGPVLRTDMPRSGADKLASKLAPDNLAYVIHTSGSTGSPKGVMVGHRAVLAVLGGATGVLGCGPGQAWSLTHSAAFDFSVWELWGPLLSGGRVVVVPRSTARDPGELWRVLRAEQVGVLSATPSAFHALAAAADADPAALRVVVLGGERCEPSRLRDWFAAFGDQQPAIVNLYGITETTVHAMHRRLTSADVPDAGVPGADSPIGVALPGVLVSVSAPVAGSAGGEAGLGELLVGGAGVARGYLGSPGLTADRFRPDHRGVEPGARLYRSGDLARPLPGSPFGPGGQELGYAGRADAQLKIRGYRIEPAEVEAALLTHPAVAQAAVGVVDDGGRAVLVGYLVVPSSQVSAGELRRHLAQRLPPHLVPSGYVLLDRLPLTRNGKLDRAALAVAPAGPPPAARTVAGPRTPTERALAQLWCELLGVAAVGVDEDFFEAGGDSLLVTRLHARLPALFGVELPMRRLYQSLTIAAQATAIDTLRLAGTPR